MFVHSNCTMGVARRCYYKVVIMSLPSTYSLQTMQQAATVPAMAWPQLPPIGFCIYPVPVEGKSEYKPETAQRDTDITKAVDLPQRISEKIQRVRELEIEVQEMAKRKLEDKGEVVEGEEAEEMINKKRELWQEREEVLERLKVYMKEGCGKVEKVEAEVVERDIEDERVFGKVKSWKLGVMNLSRNGATAGGVGYTDGEEFEIGNGERCRIYDCNRSNRTADFLCGLKSVDVGTRTGNQEDFSVSEYPLKRILILDDRLVALIDGENPTVERHDVLSDFPGKRFGFAPAGKYSYMETQKRRIAFLRAATDDDITKGGGKVTGQTGLYTLYRRLVECPSEEAVFFERCRRHEYIEQIKQHQSALDSWLDAMATPLARRSGLKYRQIRDKVRKDCEKSYKKQKLAITTSSI